MDPDQQPPEHLLPARAGGAERLDDCPTELHDGFDRPGLLRQVQDDLPQPRVGAAGTDLETFHGLDVDYDQDLSADVAVGRWRRRDVVALVVEGRIRSAGRPAVALRRVVSRVEARSAGELSQPVTQGRVHGGKLHQLGVSVTVIGLVQTPGETGVVGVRRVGRQSDRRQLDDDRSIWRRLGRCRRLGDARPRGGQDETHDRQEGGQVLAVLHYVHLLKGGCRVPRGRWPPAARV